MLPKNNKNWSHHLISIYYVAGVFCRVLYLHVRAWEWTKITSVFPWSLGNCPADPPVII